jgi:acyl-CoA hydrolase
VIPAHVSQIGPMITAGIIGCDVAFIQVSPADESGNHSCGLISDHVRAAVDRARVVIAEVNEQVPHTPGETIPAAAIDVAVHVSRAPVEVPAGRISETDQAIARHCAAYIGDGSVIQTGVGAVPDAILRLLHDRKDLGVHSGMLGDGLVELVEAGVVTNARKEVDAGVSINGALIGTKRLYAWAQRNPAIRMCSTTYTHDAAVLARLSRLVTINSALEVDLTGQVNAEQSGSAYMGGTGGQVDFVRAGARSPRRAFDHRAAATAKGNELSRITIGLNGTGHHRAQRGRRDRHGIRRRRTQGTDTRRAHAPPDRHRPSGFPRGTGAGGPYHPAAGVLMSDAVLFDVRDDGIAIITIDRPDTRNCLSREVREGLRAAWNRFERDPARASPS